MSTASPFSVPATSGGDKFEIPEAGAQPAVLVGLIDLGTHMEHYTNKNEKTGQVTEKNAPVRKIVLVWELTASPMSGMKDTNHLMAKVYSATGSPKSNLRKLLESWRGKAYAEGEAIDVSKVLGTECMITVSHGTAKSSGNTYAKLENVGPVPKGFKVPKPNRKPVMVSPTFADRPRLDAEIAALETWVPYLFGEKIGEKLRDCLEAKGQTVLLANGTTAQQPPNDNDEAPF